MDERYRQKQQNNDAAETDDRGMQPGDRHDKGLDREYCSIHRRSYLAGSGCPECNAG